MADVSYGRPVIFGEISFEIAQNGEESLGSHPLNTAWALAGFGLNPLVISRVGGDERGKRAVAGMIEFGLDTSGVQIDKVLPTGFILAPALAKEKRLTIPEAVAFDAVEKVKALEAVNGVKAALLYHGALPARSKIAMEALNALKEKLNVPVYVDVNAKYPHVKGEAAMEMIKGATWAQASKRDFEIMLGSCSFVGPDRMSMMGYLRDISNVAHLIVTTGKDGAVAATLAPNLEVKQRFHPEVVDRTGCGDAYAAVMIAGVIKKWPLELTMERANEFAARVMGIKGPISRDMKFYSEKAGEWGLP